MARNRSRFQNVYTAVDDVFAVQSPSIIALPTNLQSREAFDPRLVTVRKVKQQLLCYKNIFYSFICKYYRRNSATLSN